MKADDEEPGVVGLTRRQRNGDVLRRNPTVDAEIRVMLALPPNEIRRRASIQQQGTPDFVSAECLVYLIRDAHRRNDEGMLRALWDAITARVSPYVESKLRTLGDPYHEDGVADVVREMGLVILDLHDDRGDFFQVSFWTTVQRRTIDEFWRQKRLSERDRNFTTLGALAGEEDHSAEDDDEGIVSKEAWASQSNNALEALEQDELDVQNTIKMEIALSTLPELVRKAFVLRVEGWPIESKNPNDVTISTAMHRTPRQVRNYLKEAETRLNKWREENQ